MLRIPGCLLVVFLFTSCKKDPVTEEERSYVSIVNTVAGLTQPSIYIDTTFQFRLPYRSSYRNLQLLPGPHLLSIRDSSRVKTFLSFPSQDFVVNTSSTIVIYDTLHPVDSTVRAMRLSDDLTLAPSGFVKVRFVHTAPLINSVDVTFRRNSNPPDSITFASKQYIGNTTNVPSLSAFSDIPIGNYTLKIKRAGSQDTIMNTVKLSVTNLAGSAGISGITTFYLTGGVQGDSLRVLSFRHYP